MKKRSPDNFFKRGKRGQKLRFFVVVLCFLLCFSSCLPSKKDPLEYRSRGFSATVSVSRGEAQFEAIFHLSPPDPDGHISFRIDFISGGSLKGLSVIQTREKYTVLLDGKEFLSENSSLISELYIAKAVRALSPGEAVSSVKSDGTYTLVRAGNYVIYIDPETSLPKKSVNEAENLTVIVKEFTFD